MAYFASYDQEFQRYGNDRFSDAKGDWRVIIGRKSLIFEDDSSQLGFTAKALSDVGTQVHFASKIFDVPQEWPRDPKARVETYEGGNDSDNRLLNTLGAYDLVVVDLELDEGACRCDCCNRRFHGLHVLEVADRANCLFRMFVSSAQLSRLNEQAPDLCERLADYLKRGVTVFDKPDNPAGWALKDLRDKAAAWLAFDREGYSAAGQTRNDLYMIGRRGTLAHPEHVLILGESGTGKEQAARLIHEFGSRDAGQFRTVLCGGFTDAGLAKSELFGHVRGAYTGAVGPRVGIVLAALGAKPIFTKSTTNTQVSEVLNECAAWLDRLEAAQANLDSGRLAEGIKQSTEVIREFSSRDNKSLQTVVAIVKAYAQEASGTKDPTREYLDGLIRANPELLESTDDPLTVRVTPAAPTATIFLDEFQDLPSDVQALMIRLLEQGEMEPLGSNGKILLIDKTNRLHIRVIGASNDKAVRALTLGENPKESRVRADLVNRLKQWSVHLPLLDAKETSFFGATVENGWSEEGVKAVKKLIADGKIRGQRRELKQVILRATAIAEYDRASGRQIGVSTEVSADHLHRATRPIELARQAPAAEASSEQESVKASPYEIDPQVIAANILEWFEVKYGSVDPAASQFYSDLRALLSERARDWGLNELTLAELVNLSPRVAKALLVTLGVGERVTTTVEGETKRGKKTAKTRFVSNDLNRALSRFEQVFRVVGEIHARTAVDA